MNGPSRRQLASYAVEKLLEGRPVAELAEQLAATLVSAGRQNELNALADDIAWALESQRQVVRAKVTTATPLPEVLAQQVADFVKKSTGVSAVQLDTRLDKSVLGGLRIETATKTWDKTVAQSLKRLGEAT